MPANTDTSNSLEREPTNELVASEVVESELPMEDVFDSEEVVAPRIVHPDAAALFRCCPCIRVIPVFGPAVEAFGPKCVISLGLCYLLCKGIADQIISYSLYPMFMKHFGTTADVYQRMSSISTMGWSIKAVIAVFADTFAFFGYTKRWYMAGACVVGAACAIGYGSLPGVPSSASSAAGLIFVSSFCKACVDVLSQGHYSRLVKASPKAGADLITWIWGYIMIGAIVASAIQGTISDGGHPQIGVYVSGALQFVCAFIFIFNLYGEKPNKIARAEDLAELERELAEKDEADRRLKEEEEDEIAAGNKLKEIDNQPFNEDDYEGSNDMVGFSNEVADENGDNDVNGMYSAEVPSCCCGVWELNKEVVQRNTKVVVYGLLMAAGVIAMAVLTIIGTTWQMVYGCVVISVVLCGAAFFCLPLTAAKANLFMYIQTLTYLSLPGALDNFYMADEECLPDGPHFSQTFYNTISAVIGNCAGLVGVFLFNKVFTRHGYWLTFIVTTVVYVVASFFDLIIVERWNRPHASDHAIYIFGDAIVAQVCYMLNFMPAVILISRLCPKGSESTMYAILAGFSNLGQSMASIIGAVLMETRFPVIASPPCDFSNVKWLVIIGHMCTPLICVPIVFFLIPSVRICDNFPAKLVEAKPLSFRRMWRSIRGCCQKNSE